MIISENAQCCVQSVFAPKSIPKPNGRQTITRKNDEGRATKPAGDHRLVSVGHRRQCAVRDVCRQCLSCSVSWEIITRVETGNKLRFGTVFLPFPRDATSRMPLVPYEIPTDDKSPRDPLARAPKVSARSATSSSCRVSPRRRRDKTLASFRLWRR